MLRQLPRRIAATGQIVLPASPSLLDHYTELLRVTFGQLGRLFSAPEVASLRDTLERALVEGFARTPHASIVIDYETDESPASSLSYKVELRAPTAADEYERWTRTRAAPLFGAQPDAKVMALACSLGEPGCVRVLDVGAGTGRNALALGRAGFRVDAIELAPALAEVLGAEIEREALDVRLWRGDFLDPEIEVPPACYQLVVLSGVVTSHIRDAAQQSALFARAARALAPGGLVVLNAFVARGGYVPDTLARELSQVFWCCVQTREELAAAARGLPLERVSDEPALELERSSLASCEWPPTPWYEDWSSGRDLFDLPAYDVPVELRWMVWRKASENARAGACEP